MLPTCSRCGSQNRFHIDRVNTKLPVLSLHHGVCPLLDLGNVCSPQTKLIQLDFASRILRPGRLRGALTNR